MNWQKIHELRPCPRSSKFLVKIPFGASFLSTNSFKNHKNFRKPSPSFRLPSAPKSGPPSLAKKIGVTTRKNRREQGFHSAGFNPTLSMKQARNYFWSHLYKLNNYLPFSLDISLKEIKVPNEDLEGYYWNRLFWTPPQPCITLLNRDYSSPNSKSIS